MAHRYSLRSRDKSPVRTQPEKPAIPRPEYVFLVAPVAHAIKELEIGTTQESIAYNYFQHCLNISRGTAEKAEKEALPTLNKKIIETWGIKALDSMKRAAWAKVDKLP